jgi:hypothetical protein
LGKVTPHTVGILPSQRRWGDRLPGGFTSSGREKRIRRSKRRRSFENK